MQIPDKVLAGCCEWDTFCDGFEQFWSRYFEHPPALKDWRAARRDWRTGNTGFEAAHNAQRRARQRAVAKEHRAWTEASGLIRAAAQQRKPGATPE